MDAQVRVICKSHSTADWSYPIVSCLLIGVCGTEQTLSLINLESAYCGMRLFFFRTILTWTSIVI